MLLFIHFVKTVMNILAIIPARKGSKGVPMKNIQKILGRPIIEYPIISAKKSKFVNKIVVSTDSQKIAKIVETMGAEVPFLRPKKLSLDATPELDVIKHTLKFLKTNQSYIPDIVITLHATNPFVTSSMIDRSIKMLKSSDADLIIGVHQIKTHPYRSFWYRNGYLKRFNKNFNKYYQRQKFPPLYFPSGDFYTFWYKSFKKHGIIYGPKIKPLFYKKDEVSLYIDTIFDLFECEMTMKHWKKFEKKFNAKFK